MAGIFDRIVSSFKFDPDDEFEPDDEFGDLDYSETEKSSASRRNYDIDEALELDDDEEEEEPVKKPLRERIIPKRPSPSNVVSMNRGVGSGNFEVCVVKPVSVNDTKEICDILMQGKAVVLNLEDSILSDAKREMAQRVVDFVGGACYAIDGNFQPISNNIYIITPNSVYLSGDFANGDTAKQNSGI
ncbi:MAG: cell division protein SepF [Lachnospiraceae bacterium]|nr:cell division protein SepF [Candidatus Minthocola equi]